MAPAVDEGFFSSSLRVCVCVCVKVLKSQISSHFTKSALYSLLKSHLNSQFTQP